MTLIPDGTYSKKFFLWAVRCDESSFLPLCGLLSNAFGKCDRLARL